MTAHHIPDPDPLDIRVGVCPVCRWPVGDVDGHVAIAHPDDEPYDGWRGDEDFNVFAARREREMYAYYEARRQVRRRWLILAIVVVIGAVFVVQIAASRRGSEAPSTAPTLSGTLLVGAGEPSSAVEPIDSSTTDGSVPPLPDTATSVVGIASWFCHPPKYPRCTRGVPASSYAAAAGPALRVGDWRGRIVKVCAVGGRCVRVRLSDWCACGGGRVVDLYHSAFAAIANPSRGVVRVEVTWGASTRVVLPATDTALHGESE